jgi:hypothetical protein
LWLNDRNGAQTLLLTTLRLHRFRRSALEFLLRKSRIAPPCSRFRASLTRWPGDGDWVHSENFPNLHRSAGQAQEFSLTDFRGAADALFPKMVEACSPADLLLSSSS